MHQRIPSYLIPMYKYRNILISLYKTIPISVYCTPCTYTSFKFTITLNVTDYRGSLDVCYKKKIVKK